MFRLSVLLVACIGLMSCTTTTPISGSKIDKSYNTGGFQWASGSTVIVVFKLFETNGNVGVCGAWGVRGTGVLGNVSANEPLSAGVLYLGRSRILQGVEFMQPISLGESVVGKPAICRSTSVKWRPEFADARQKLRFPAMTFR